MGCSVMLPSLWRKSVQIRNLNTVLWVVLLCGCAGKLDISNLELSSNVHEGCFSPTTTMDVYYYKNGFNQKYELLSPKAPWCSNDIFMESCQKVFPISKSGEIKLDGPLYFPMCLLLLIHILQFIFFRRFLDET